MKRKGNVVSRPVTFQPHLNPERNKGTVSHFFLLPFLHPAHGTANLNIEDPATHWPLR